MLNLEQSRGGLRDEKEKRPPETVAEVRILGKMVEILSLERVPEEYQTSEAV